ncbi:hypothetical protein IB265_30865 [Ensifer sp. ENS10]|uniref:hypothetical protein n=1 Tax=unclassified Ensifer TaxID=2633371 RepID=UPI000A967F92|nr:MULTISPECIES: hypothetical protein [unclassified Ensifer]MBD9511173.1 hypothetical protein [Ensifer sp. ENS10]MBV7522404.1 hypothetical protein [Ensifer sp. ENS12]
MRPSSGQFLCVCVASLYLSGSCEVLGLAVATMLTLVSYIAVNQFRETDEPAIDPRALAAPAAVRLH